MKSFVLLLAVSMLVAFSAGEKMVNLMGTDLQKCVNCLCHARTTCFSRFNCARYSINLEYWKKAGGPLVQDDDTPNSDDSYKKCMMNENCILNTVSKYTESFGRKDCNCDGEFDCKDRLAIHLFGESCQNPKFGATVAMNFNQCAKQIGVKEMLETEGSDGCVPEVF